MCGRNIFVRWITCSAAAILLLFFAGCKSADDFETVGLVFERAHGSVWGNQFYVEVCADEIIEMRYFPEGEIDPVTVTHIPVTSMQWNALRDTVQSLPLTKVKPSLRERLFGQNKLDGGEYRHLTLIQKNAQGETAVLYEWPQSEQAAELEKQLKQLTQNVK